MCRTSDEVLDAMPATNDLPALQTAAATLKTLLSQLDPLPEVQRTPTTGKTVDRQRAFAAAAEATLQTARIVYSYAKSQRNGDLMAKTLVRVSHFHRLRLAERIALMQQVHTAATAVLAQLAPYGVTAATLAGLKTKIDAAEALLTQFRAAILARAVVTEQIGDILRRAEDVLAHDIDPLVDTLRMTHPEDWAKYRAARAIIHLPGASKAAAKSATTTNTPASQKLAA